MTVTTFVEPRTLQGQGKETFSKGLRFSLNINSRKRLTAQDGVAQKEKKEKARHVTDSRKFR